MFASGDRIVGFRPSERYSGAVPSLILSTVFGPPGFPEESMDLQEVLPFRFGEVFQKVMILLQGGARASPFRVHLFDIGGSLSVLVANRLVRPEIEEEFLGFGISSKHRQMKRRVAIGIPQVDKDFSLVVQDRFHDAHFPGERGPMQCGRFPGIFEPWIGSVFQKNVDEVVATSDNGVVMFRMFSASVPPSIINRWIGASPPPAWALGSAPSWRRNSTRSALFVATAT